MIERIDSKIFSHTLTKRELSIHYQPIVSVKNKRIIGVEALTRAYYNNEFISPEALFSYAVEVSEGHILDDLCRREAVSQIRELETECLVFINCEANYIDYYIEHSEGFIGYLKNLNINSGHIVIEINEKKSKSIEHIQAFIDIFRANGFLIALDDVGAGHSNLNRIAAARPDIVKIDRQTISNIDSDFYKQETVRAIVNLANRIGAITIAEGVETSEETVACLQLGIDIYQGFYFSKAVPTKELGMIQISTQLRSISNQYKEKSVCLLIEKLNKKNQYKSALNKLISMLLEDDCDNFDCVLQNFLDTNPNVECAYILNIEGCQVTDTVIKKCISTRCSLLFSPGKRNDCHDLKSYYYSAIEIEPEIFTTHKYISIATGSLCVTNSMVFSHQNGKKYIACVDYFVEENE